MPKKFGEPRPFAVQLVVYFFSKRELTRDNVNVNGVGSRGSRKERELLDPTRLALIRTTYFEKISWPDSDQNNHWKKEGVPALSKKISELKKRVRHNLIYFITIFHL